MRTEQNQSTRGVRKKGKKKKKNGEKETGVVTEAIQIQSSNALST